MSVVTPTGHPKSVRNRRVIKVLGGFLCCRLVVEFSVGMGVLVIGLSQLDLFLFLFHPRYCTPLDAICITTLRLSMEFHAKFHIIPPVRHTCTTPMVLEVRPLRRIAGASDA